MRDNTVRPIANAILAAVLYALSTPVSKILMSEIPPSFLAGILYLGAGIGMIPISLIKRRAGSFRRIGRTALPYIIGMVVLDQAKKQGKKGCVVFGTRIFSKRDRRKRALSLFKRKPRKAAPEIFRKAGKS